tara:strand:- start:20285 stop:20917 length:633 start_codon:yes stop_codon:yes gene_type:complete
LEGKGDDSEIQEMPVGFHTAGRIKAENRAKKIALFGINDRRRQGVVHEGSLRPSRLCCYVNLTHQGVTRMKYRYNFQEAIEKVKSDPGTRMIGAFMQGADFFGLFDICLTEDELDDPSVPCITYRGSHFFSTKAEEDFYLEEDEPILAALVTYVVSNNLPDFFYCQAEIAAYKLLKDLPEPSTLRTLEERADFSHRVHERMKAKWTVFGS